MSDFEYIKKYSDYRQMDKEDLYIWLDNLRDEETKLQQQLKEQKKLNEEHQRINGELREENKQLKECMSKLELENKVLKEQMVAMVQPNYTYGIRGDSNG